MKKSIVFILAFALLFTMIPSSLIANAEDDVFTYASLNNYLISTFKKADDGYIGIPVNYAVYAEDNSASTRDVIYYVINHAGERIGTESDESIIESYVKEGYVVVTVDFLNNPLSVSPNIEFSLAKMRTTFRNAGFTGTNIKPHRDFEYFLPAGYRIKRDVVYFDILKHAVNGTTDYIVDVWNRVIANNSKYTDNNGNMLPTATKFSDLVKKDGTPIETKYKLDIIYPSMPKYKTPVYAMAATQGNRHKYAVEEAEPHFAGFNFKGYTTVNYDHEYIPMAREDHYGYFDPFSISTWNAPYVARAAIRCIRYYAKELGYDTEHIGVTGISKATPSIAVLSNKNNETIEPSATFSSNPDGITPEPQPFLTYDDGSKISSEVNVVYIAAGGGAQNYKKNVKADNRPTLISCGKNDPYGCWSYWYPMVDHYKSLGSLHYMAMGMEDKGHEYPNGYDNKFEYERYDMFMKFFDRYLKPGQYNPEVMYVTPNNNIKNASPFEDISVKFVDKMDVQSVKNGIKVTNAATGSAVNGTYNVSEGDSMFDFVHDPLTAGQIYKIEVTTGCKNAEGNFVEKTYTKQFKVIGNESIENIADTYISASQPDANFGAESKVIIDSNEGAEKTAFLTFETAFVKTASTASLYIPKCSAASSVNVYLLDNYAVDEASLTKNNAPSYDETNLVVSGALTDSGNCQLDISSIINKVTGDKFTLVIEPKSTKLAQIMSYDFENMTLIKDDSKENKVYSETGNYCAGGAPGEITIVSDENASVGGSKSVRITGKHGYDRFKLFNALKTSALTSEDSGKLYKVSFKAKANHEGSLTAGFMSANSGSGNYDYTGPTSNFGASFYKEAEKGVTVELNPDSWTKAEFYVTVDDTMINQQIGLLTFQTNSGASSRYFYIDDVSVSLVSEKTGETSFDSKENASKKQAVIILNTLADNWLSPSISLSVNGGADSDKAGSTNLTTSVKADVEKSYKNISYLKFEIPDNVTDSAILKFNTVSAANQKIAVYGIDAKNANRDEDAYGGSDHRWTGAGLTFHNAVGIDKTTNSILKDYAYGGAPIGYVTANGANTSCEVDVTDYVKMISKNTVGTGKKYATIALVPEGVNTRPQKAMNFENQKEFLYEDTLEQIWSDKDFRVGGGANKNSLVIDSSINHTNGGTASLKFQNRNAEYYRVKLLNLIKDDGFLTKADIGRKFEVKFYAYINEDIADTTKIKYGLISPVGSNVNKFTKTTPLKKGEWVECNYTFTVTDGVVGTEGSYDSTQFACVDIETSGAVKNLWLDDFTVTELSGGAVIDTPTLSIGKTSINAAESAGITSLNPNKTSSVLEIKSYDSPYGANGSKVYFKFGNVDTTNAKDAKIVIYANGANTINLYKLPLGDISSKTTYNSAPFNNIYGEGLELTPYATKEVSGEGIVSFDIDVSDIASVFAISAVTKPDKTIADIDFEDENISFVQNSDWWSRGGYGGPGEIVSLDNGKKAIRFSNIKSSTGRVKFNGMLKNSPFTKDDVGRTFTVKMSLMPGDKGYTAESPSTITDVTGSKNVRVGVFGNYWGNAASNAVGTSFIDFELNANKWTSIEFNVNVTQEMVDKLAYILTIEQRAYPRTNTIYVDDIKITEKFGDCGDVNILSIDAQVKKPIEETYKASINIKNAVNYIKNSKNYLLLGADAEHFGNNVKDISFYNNGEKINSYLTKNGNTGYIELENANPGNYSVYAVATFEDGTTKQSDTIDFRVYGTKLIAQKPVVTGSVSGKNISVEWNVSNPMKTDENVLFILASYDENNNLIKCTFETVNGETAQRDALTLKSGEDISIKQSLTDIGENVSYVKAYIWTGTSLTTPVTGAVTVK